MLTARSIRLVSIKTNFTKEWASILKYIGATRSFAKHVKFFPFTKTADSDSSTHFILELLRTAGASIVLLLFARVI